MPDAPHTPPPHLIAVTIHLPPDMLTTVDARRGKLTRGEFCSLAAAVQILRRTSVFSASLGMIPPDPGFTL